MKYFVASIIVTNLLHGWLVFSQRANSPATISYHSIKNKRTLLIYIIGHLISGVLLWLFAKDFFGGRPQTTLVLALTALAVVSEWLQALVPAKGKTDTIHTFFATIMAASMALLVLLCTVFFSPNKLVLAINLLLSTVVASFLLFIRYPPKAGTWKLQFAGQIILYLQIFLLVY